MAKQIDLSQVSTRALVEEAQRRAPKCPNGDPIPMLVGPSWFTCPVCKVTKDFE